MLQHLLACPTKPFGREKQFRWLQMRQTSFQFTANRRVFKLIPHNVASVRNDTDECNLDPIVAHESFQFLLNHSHKSVARRWRRARQQGVVSFGRGGNRRLLDVSCCQVCHNSTHVAAVYR